MRATARTLLALAAAATLTAIWSPVGAWWQWALTALVLALAGAFLAGTADRRDAEMDIALEDPLMPEDVAAEFIDTSDDTTRPTYGKKARP